MSPGLMAHENKKGRTAQGKIMAVMDEFREEREMIKHGTKEQKIQYFKDYYRTPLIIAIVAVVFIGAFLYNYFTAKETAFYAAMLNASSYGEEEIFEQNFAQAAGIDLNRYSIFFDIGFYYKFGSTDEDTYITAQKLSAYTGAAALDVMIGSGAEFAVFANSPLFYDLRLVLNEEQIAAYEPYFYYVDEAVSEKLASSGIDSTEFADFPDPRHPEEMEKPVPVAIFVDSSENLTQNYYFRNSEENGVALGIYSNSTHVENAVKLIDYLLK